MYCSNSRRLTSFFVPTNKTKGPVGRAEHTVNLVDADVAVFCRFSGGQRHFEVDRHLQFLDHTPDRF